MTRYFSAPEPLFPETYQRDYSKDNQKHDNERNNPNWREKMENEHDYSKVCGRFVNE